MPAHRKNKQENGKRAPRKTGVPPLVRFWRNISFRKKTILYTSIMLYVFILVFGLLIYNSAVYSMNDLNKESVRQRLQTLDDELKAQFSGYSTIAGTLLLDRNIQEDLEEAPRTLGECREYDWDLTVYLNALCASRPVSATWDLYFTYNRPRSFANNIYSISTAYKEQWYKDLTAQRGNIITWTPIPGTLSTYPMFQCSIGVVNKENRHMPAYFKMNVEAAPMISTIQDAAKKIDGVFLFCTDEGEIMWSSGEPEDYSDYILPQDAFNDSLEPVLVNGSQGEHTVIVLPGGKYNYNVFCILNNISPLSRFLDFGRYFLFVLGVIIVLSLTTLRSSASLVDGRITNLTREIKALDESDLTYLPDTTSRDEVGELSRAFSELVERVKLLIEHEHKFEEERFALEVDALQAQINPHFLFNTLSIINLLARQIEADNISEAVEALAQFYRFSLQNGKKLITLRDELAILDNYLTICSIRYRNQLQVRREVDPSVLDCVIPKLVLQPFCENAVFHGFAAGSSKVHELSITARPEGSDLLVQIGDNGEGMTPAELEIALKTGFGIANVHKRIQMIYGEEYGVSIASTPGVGTVVSIRLGQKIKETGEKGEYVNENQEREA